MPGKSTLGRRQRPSSIDPAADRPKWRWMDDPNLWHQITFFVSGAVYGRPCQPTVTASHQAESSGTAHVASERSMTNMAITSHVLLKKWIIQIRFGALCITIEDSDTGDTRIVPSSFTHSLRRCEKYYIRIRWVTIPFFLKPGLQVAQTALYQHF